MKVLTLIAILCVFSARGQNGPVILEGKNSASQIVAAAHPGFSFLLPEMAGSLEFGIIHGGKSKWLKDFTGTKITADRKSIKYVLQGDIPGELIVEAIALTATDGLIIEVIARNFPAGAQLFWAYGGASGKTDAKPALLPEYCRYNVFSVEGTAFTVYYGESMKLKILQGVMPPASEIRLSDAFRQDSPLAFFESGKKTGAPALAAVFPLKNGQKEYFCIYRQNAAADYNYFMLPEVFAEAKAGSR